MTDLALRPASPPPPSAPVGDIPPFRLRREMNGIAEAPGKVWFFELAAAVIDAERCVQCGACVAACPTDSIGVDDDDLPYLVKMCTGCSLCWDFCPRGGMRYESTWLSSSPPAQAPPEVVADLGATIAGADPAPGFGEVVASYAARVRPDSPFFAPGSQDGGVVTAVLLAALDSGVIDGALVAREDPLTPWRGVPKVATTREQIIEAGGSFYNQTMALAALDLSRVGLGPDAKIAVVGTPCEIQGIRALQASEWRRGNSQVDAIVLTIALMCTKSFDYRRLIVDAFATERGLDLREIGKVDVVHGRMFVWDRSGAVLVDEPVKAFHGAALKGCDECADFLGRAADLAVGSVGSADGFSSVLVRTVTGARALEAIIAEVDYLPIERPEALTKLDQLDKRIAFSSLERDFDPNGPLFIDFADHVNGYSDTGRAPVWRGR
jgi:coenzyme F420 hydrogenase subunit beta